MKLEIDFEVERRLGDPLVKIIIDDYITLYDGVAQDHFEFEIDLPNGGHDLNIVHHGKKPHHHTLDKQGNILVDRHVHIKSIKLDGTIFRTNSEILEQAKNFFKDLPDV